MSRRWTRVGGLLAAAAALCWMPKVASSQCFIPDNLSGPCCQLIAANLPQFPGFEIQGQGICWQTCAVSQQECLFVRFAPPIQTICAQFVSPVTVTDCFTGQVLLTGDAILDYTRTWGENVAPGVDYQVWRFMAKVDFATTPGPIVPPCPVPRCLAQHPDAFFYGYVDYALNCQTMEWEESTVLFHNCDPFIHAPSLSSRPGSFHPGETYAVIAPDTPANPFTPFVSVFPPAGPPIAEAVRNVTNPMGLPLCTFEEPLAGGDHLPLISLCFCPLSLASLQQTLVSFKGFGTCPDISGVPSSFTSVNFFPMVPWFHMVSTSIGCWTNPTTYPGPECVLVDEGLFAYYDSCKLTPVGGFPKSAEIFYGATTVDGFPVFPLFGSMALTPNFVDLASNWSHTMGAGITPTPPVFGKVGPTDHLIYTNIP